MLLDSEIWRIRHELGYNVLSVGAEPYISVYAVFDQVIQPYLTGGVASTSTTAVTAATTPTSATLTLADATGFEAGQRVLIDVDSLQEAATVRSVSGSTIVVLLTKAHSGTYPVFVEGPEAIIRGILAKLESIAGLMAGGTGGQMGAASSAAGIKKVDEIEFFGGGNTIGSQGKDRTEQLNAWRELWRDELAYALGIPRLNKMSGGSSMVVY